MPVVLETQSSVLLLPTRNHLRTAFRRLGGAFRQCSYVRANVEDNGVQIGGEAGCLGVPVGRSVRLKQLIHLIVMLSAQGKCSAQQADGGYRKPMLAPEISGGRTATKAAKCGLPLKRRKWAEGSAISINIG